MEIKYKSTRNSENKISASLAILKGLADDGGLYVPDNIPEFKTDWDSFSRLGYKECAYEILRLYLSDFTDEEIRKCVEKAYDEKFDTEKIAPLNEADGVYYLELFHGKTIAFKDMALSILPHLLKTAARKNNITNDIVILTATSGDTGKAALEGFTDVAGTKIIVFYPKGGVSRIQELQMITQKGENTFVAGVNGNFDDAQTGVKNMFNDAGLKKLLNDNGYRFSSANSINIGRLIPQIAYYFWGYSQLVKDRKIKAGEKINFCVPTGNFGNILAGYYAKSMKLPVNKLICASNENKVLYDFFKTGQYDKNREFILTSSPSMDILISSNLERLIYKAVGEDSVKTGELMKSLDEKGMYILCESGLSLIKDFAAGFADREETKEQIRKVFEKTGYVIDPHTAVAGAAYDKYRKETKDETKTVIISTASPYKFARSVVASIDGTKEALDDFELTDELKTMSKTDIPRAVKEIQNAEIRHKSVVETDKMEEAVKGFLGLK